MYFLYLKSLHIIFIVTWFAGLFYILRLFIYHAEAESLDPPARSILQKQYKIMESRLWYIITWPSSILATLLGLSLISDFLPLSDFPWLIKKLFFVFLLWAYHLYTHYLFLKFQKNIILLSSKTLRLLNELPTLLLFAIVFLVVTKDIMSMAKGILSLFLLMSLLMIGIKIYQKLRK